jgi:hypothetical protein
MQNKNKRAIRHECGLYFTATAVGSPVERQGTKEAATTTGACALASKRTGAATINGQAAQTNLHASSQEGGGSQTGGH